MCHVIVGFHVLCVDLGFHVVIGVGPSHRSAGRFYTSTSFHHAYAIPSTKFPSSGCCGPTLSCHRQLNLYPKFLHISHRENGSFEVLSLQYRRHLRSRSACVEHVRQKRGTLFLSFSLSAQIKCKIHSESMTSRSVI